MPQLIAWGNNTAGNLDPALEKAIIETPTKVLKDLTVDEICWASWASTIGRVGVRYHAWAGPPTEDLDAVTLLDLEHEAVKFLGPDEATVYLDKTGFVNTLHPELNDSIYKRSSEAWHDIVLTGKGYVYASSDTGIYRFKSFENFMINTEPCPINHPLLDPRHPTSLFANATESRVFALSKGPLVHLVELKEDQDDKVAVDLVEDLEGLGVEDVITGSANRFGVLTEAGDAYLIERRRSEPELLEIEDESPVRFLGVGSKHEVVVTEENIWVRGDNQFSQLGIGGDASEGFVRLEYFNHEMVKRIQSVHCGRWSTIVVMKDT